MLHQGLHFRHIVAYVFVVEIDVIVLCNIWFLSFAHVIIFHALENDSESSPGSGSGSGSDHDHLAMLVAMAI